VNLTEDQIQMTIYAVRDLITRRTLGGQRIPNGFHAFLDQLATSADGSGTSTDEPRLTPDELIDTTEAATILKCSTRWIRQIHNDLDGRNVSGRWLFNRHIVVEYAAEERQSA
jgi:hypothetical protein